MATPVIVQLLNPKSKTYVLVDRSKGSILKHHPKKNTPYRHVPIVRGN